MYIKDMLHCMKKSLFLRFESGILVSYREEDNTHFYANKKRMEERNMSDLCEAIFGVKTSGKRKLAT